MSSDLHPFQRYFRYILLRVLWHLSLSVNGEMILSLRITDWAKVNYVV